MFGIKPSKEKLMDKIEKLKRKITKIEEKISNEFEAKNIRKLEIEKKKIEEEISKMAKMILNKEGKLETVKEENTTGVQQPQQQFQQSVQQPIPQQFQQPQQQFQQSVQQPIPQQFQQPIQQPIQQPEEFYMDSVDEQAYPVPPQQFVNQPNISNVEDTAGIVSLSIVFINQTYDFSITEQQFSILIKDIQDAINNNEAITIGNKLINTRNILYVQF